VTTTILGVLVVVWPQVSTVGVDVYIGAIFFLAGAVGLALMFFAPEIQQRRLSNESIYASWLLQKRRLLRKHGPLSIAIFWVEERPAPQ
jgi:uncharacterized membrane protein HdeD (DUF308 family)